jgi:hypothetical protein
VKPLVEPLFIMYDVLSDRLRGGVWRSAGRKRALLFTGSLMVGIGIIGLVLSFFPLHMRDCANAILLAIGFRATAFGRRLRLYLFTVSSE